jgi:hypothetical protein
MRAVRPLAWHAQTLMMCSGSARRTAGTARRATARQVAAEFGRLGRQLCSLTSRPLARPRVASARSPSARPPSLFGLVEWKRVSRSARWLLRKLSADVASLR